MQLPSLPVVTLQALQATIDQGSQSVVISKDQTINISLPACQTSSLGCIAYTTGTLSLIQNCAIITAWLRLLL